MGLIKNIADSVADTGVFRAGASAISSVLADQWKEFFYCEAMEPTVLMKRGIKTSTSRGVNTKGNDNIISDGSGIVVADGQCMLIVEQGKVVEVCAEPGEFTYNSSTEPSIFAGSLGESIKNTFKILGKRFTYGGETGKDQRVYYINIKEIYDNMFGTANPIPFRVVDSKIGLDLDTGVRCSGTYSYVISDPILFYTNICGNTEGDFTRDKLEKTMKTEFIQALGPSIGKLSAQEVRPSNIPLHNEEIAEAVNENLSKKWGELRGMTVKSIAFGNIILPDEDAQMIKDLQRNASLADPGRAAATLVTAQAEAMKAAASNESGAMMGFMGMGMAMNQGGMNAQNLFAMNQQNQQARQTAPKGADGWMCACGNMATGNFCTECGAKKPEATGWTCQCGAVNKGKFCAECGAKKPEGAPLYKCDKCGFEPEDPKNPPKFCPECGDPFDASDIK